MSSSPVYFRPIRGNLVLAPDPDQTSWRGIWFSDNMHKKSETGLVVFHDPWFLDECLFSRRVLVEKWSWRQIKLGAATFYIVPELAVFAVLEEGNSAQPKEGRV